MSLAVGAGAAPGDAAAGDVVAEAGTGHDAVGEVGADSAAADDDDGVAVAARTRLVEDQRAARAPDAGRAVELAVGEEAVAVAAHQPAGAPPPAATADDRVDHSHV